MRSACQITPRNTLAAAQLAGILLPDSPPKQAAEAGLCALNARNRKPGHACQRVRSRPRTRSQLPSWQVFSRLTAYSNRHGSRSVCSGCPETGSQAAPAACQITPRNAPVAAGWQELSRLTASPNRQRKPSVCSDCPEQEARSFSLACQITPRNTLAAARLAGILPPDSPPEQAAEARSCPAACQITPRSTLTAARLAGTLLPDSQPKQAAEAGLCALNARNRKPSHACQRVRSRPRTRSQLPSWQAFSRLTAYRIGTEAGLCALDVRKREAKLPLQRVRSRPGTRL